MLFFRRNNGKISRAQQFQVSHRRNNIVQGEVRVCLSCKDEEVKRNMAFHNFLQASHGILATIVVPPYNIVCNYKHHDFNCLN